MSTDFLCSVAAYYNLAKENSDYPKLPSDVPDMCGEKGDVGSKLNFKVELQTANAQIQKISILSVKRIVMKSMLILDQVKLLMLDKNVFWLSFVIPHTQKDADS